VTYIGESNPVIKRGEKGMLNIAVLLRGSKRRGTTKSHVKNLEREDQVGAST